MMFNINNSENEIPSDATINDTNSGMGRSVSSARFQIAKVSNNNTNTENSLGKAISIPNSLSQTVGRTSISNTTNIKIFVGDDANESGSTSSVLPRTTDINTNCTSTEDENKEICSYDTIDALPHVDHYRNLFSITSPEPKSRPTLEALHETASASGRFRLGSTIDLNSELLSTLTPQIDQLSQLDVRPKIDVVKFGWIIGVFIRCVLNIFGVMLFLRLSWVTGQAGLGLAAIIVLTSTAVTVLTGLSMSAICTNGEVKGGGTYYLISRSLGPEFGGAIGLVFSFANAVAAAMYTIGFAETIRDLLKENNVKILGTVADGESVNIVRIIGVITITIILGIALIGMRGETVVQIILLIALSASLLNFFIGSLLPVTEYKRRHGFEGYSWKVIKENFGPRFANGESFQHVFGVFFPSVTGILAGANISGNLKNPSKAIPLGTNAAIVLTSSVYFIFCIISGCTTRRDVTLDYYERSNGSVIQIINCSSNTDDLDCKSGLIYNYQTMRMISAFGPIITAGIFAATLSSALASLVGAPKIFQAVCRDMIFPSLKYFSAGSGKSDEPHRAYFLTYFIAVLFTAIGQLNHVAPIISNFFLMTYALVNYSCFDASLAKASGWRPAFRYYNKWLALVGALLCVGIMFIINWYTALITLVISGGIFLYVRTTKPEVNWGSSVEAHTYRRALDATLKLEGVQEHVKNFRPQMLVLTGNPVARPALVDLGSLVSHGYSLMICGHVILDDPLVNIKISDQKENGEAWLKKRNAKAFYQTIIAPTIRHGTIALLQCVGVGKMRPNVVFLGFKNDWLTKPQSTVDYFNILHDALDLNYGVGILRLQSGLDFTDFFGQDLPGDQDDDDDNEDSVDEEKPEEFVSSSPLRRNSKCSQPRQSNVGMLKNTILNKGALITMNVFHSKHSLSTIIDVWWLFDDGGLTLLLPYLLRRRKRWRHSQFRIFSCVSGENVDAEKQHLAMASLLKKFRINYTDLHVLHGLNKTPNEHESERFNQILQTWNQNEDKYRITDSEYEANKEKMRRGLKLHEYLLEYSSKSTLIVLTLPIPRKQLISAGLYLAYLDAISYNLPPVLFLRGNQKNVLTYYS
ncbi:unnamed protein product [Rotaria socialis]|uniref:Solute carrier family 12 member 2 n=1 Tax=Rotaria socialis TaxID=392032 RepID=A0A817TNF8_9BILA|nr:unnamed protein product [Rotaria socialis]CAF3320423.1 unnamed protein product [Rotaria socialis]CAF4384043.1 unnamed protein product [Rotaria socialis]CAF4425971.1 unnamed protein product [Rotaria socialis]